MDKSILEELVSQGFSAAEIARHLNRPASTVNANLKRFNLRTTHAKNIEKIVDYNTLNELVHQGLSSTEMSEKLNRPASTIRVWLRKLNLKTSHCVEYRRIINHDILKTLIDKNLSSYQIAKQIGCSASSVRACVKKLNLVSKFHKSSRAITGTEKLCTRCKKVFSVNRFREFQKGSFLSWCKDCSNEVRGHCRRKNKIKAVERKGGKCQVCGYNKYVGALDFHHIDPSKKEFNIGNVYKTAEKLNKELDKCVLVCSNCHREIHGGIIKVEDIKYGLPYK